MGNSCITRTDVGGQQNGQDWCFVCQLFSPNPAQMPKVRVGNKRASCDRVQNKVEDVLILPCAHFAVKIRQFTHSLRT